MGLTTQTGQPWMVLLKLGQSEHLEMLRKGLMYMNSLAFFTSIEESDPARGDSYEGTDSIIQPSDVRDFTIDSRTPGFEKIHISSSDLGGPVRIALRQTSACNIFCLFAVNKPIDGPIFPKLYRWFGDSLLLFTNTQEFLSRVVAAAKRQGLKGEARLVEYYDANRYSGRIGRFHKPSRYAHQREYRIALETGVEGPFRFEIGDLTDITSEVIPLESADDVLKFRTEDAEAAGLLWH
jgi:hypothetical protein